MEGWTMTMDRPGQPHPSDAEFTVIPDLDLQEWEQPKNIGFTGHYSGGRYVRVSNGPRKFLLTLAPEPATEVYNFSASFRDGLWVNTTRKCPEVQVVAASEIIEALIPVFPSTEEFSVWFRCPWTVNGGK
jgi:hypothetical protein